MPTLNEPQPPPIDQGSAKPVWNMVIEDMIERHKVGVARYGTPLQINNGRDFLVDAYQEALDHIVYLRGEIEQRRQADWARQARQTSSDVPDEYLEPKNEQPLRFLEAFIIESDRARSIVRSRDQEGRNAAVAVKDQFPSTGFVLDLIRMKLARAESYLAAGNFAKYQEELHDCSNYSLFAIVFESN